MTPASTDTQRRRRRLPQRRSGFVLIVALGLMSVILVLILSFTVRAQIELRNVEATKQRLLAKENARLGLMIALGELQKHAGPDQRVTAQANIRGEAAIAEGASFWTGVWDTSDEDSSPVWLVSASNNVPPDPADPGDTVLLSPVSSTTLPGASDAAARSVSVPTAQIGPYGKFAYWIADEGVKASLAPIFEASKVQDGNSPNSLPAEDFLRQRSALASGRPDFVSEAGLLAAEQRGFGLMGMSELPLAWSSTAEEQRFLQQQLDQKYHDFTARTYGLLTNTVEGGFRHDLSSLDRLSPDLAEPKHAWINAAVRQGLNLWSEVDAGTLEPRIIGGSNQVDDPSLRITPIISELFIGTAISGNASNPSAEEIFIYYLIFAELWNPFTAPLNLSRRDNYDDIIVRVSGLPQVELTNETQGITRDIELPSLVMDLDFYDFIDGAEQDRFEPGRITWTGNPRSSGGGSATVEGQQHLRRNGVYIVSDPIGSIPGTTVEDFHGKFSATDLTIEFFLKGTAFEHPDDPHQLFWTLDINGFEEFEIDYIGGDGSPNDYDGSPSQFFRPRNTAAHGVNRASINQTRNSFNYWLRLDEELFAPGNDDFRLITEANALQRNRTTLDLRDTLLQGLNRVYEVGAFPEQTQRDITFSNLDFFSGKDSPFDSSPERWAFLVDLPIRPPVELAQLNFLTFAEENFEKLGHPNSGELNQLYDRYFMSGLNSEHSSTPQKGDITPNPRYRIANTASYSDFETWAGDLFSIGAFNVNSTSAAAWAEIFAGSDLESWPSGTDSDAPRERLRNAWFSMPDFGPGMFDRVYSGNDNYRRLLRKDGQESIALENFFLPNIPLDTPVVPAFRQGLRELDPADRRRLGEEISRRVRERQRPFFSLRDFLDSGIVQQAIEAVPELNADATGNTIPAHSPAYFSQIKFAQNAGSRLSARSDTFRIIVSGESINPATGRSVVARCEALVQRVPRRPAPDNLPSATEREFVIVNFQWLN